MTYDPATYWPARYKAQGPSYVGPGGDPAATERQRAFLEPLLARYVKGPRVLDFGCGPGRFRPVLEGLCAPGGYVGVDLVPGLGTQELGEHLPRDFDSAVAIYVLQHIVADAQYQHWVRELYACLRPSGRLFVVDAKILQSAESLTHRGGRPVAHYAPHMKPRGLFGLAWAGKWANCEFVGEYDGHWIGVLHKP